MLDVEITFSQSAPALEEIMGLYRRVALQRPTDDDARMARILSNSNAFAIARKDGILVGVARGISDTAHVCYLADVAVAPEHQRRGVGRALVRAFLKGVGPEVTTVVHAAKGASGFYSNLGFQRWNDVFRWQRTT